MSTTRYRTVAKKATERARKPFNPLFVCLATTVLWLTMAGSGLAQVTGGITGSVIDAQGLVVPGATVTLISDTRGTVVGSTVTNERGVFVIANVSPDVYTILVEMPSFKTLKRSGIEISPGPTTSVGTFTIDVGGTEEVVNVTAEAPLIQTVSGEKSFTVTGQQSACLFPILGRDFGSRYSYARRDGRTGLTAVETQGGSGETNFMVDGVTSIDAGINRQAQKVSVEAIAEVRALTSSYQAEFGRVSGLQVNVVTKSGTNIPRIDVPGREELQVELQQQGEHTQRRSQGGHGREDWGFTLGARSQGGRNNKLFFFTNFDSTRALGAAVSPMRSDPPGTARRLFTDHRPQRQPVPIHQGSAHQRHLLGLEHAGVFPGRRRARPDPERDALSDRLEHPGLVA